MQQINASVSQARVLKNPTTWLRWVVLVIADLITAAFSWVIALSLRHVWDSSLMWDVNIRLFPMVFLFPMVYWLAGLYGVGIAPPEELRRLTYSTSLIFLALGAASLVYKAEAEYSPAVFILAWPLALVLVPLGRALARHLFAQRSGWGVPVLILGAGKTGEMVVRALERHPGLGLRPIAVLDDDPSKRGQKVGKVTVEGGLNLTEQYARAGVGHVIIAMPGVPRNRLLEILEAHGTRFPHLIVVPDLFGLPSLWVTPKDIGGVLGFEVQQKLLLPVSKWVKRVMDLSFALALALPLLFLVALLGLLIRLDSAGPVFYSQVRIGQNGKRFRIWKFRTMVQDADRKLAEYIERHPEVREEWERDQKLKNDPRITRVGRFLRKTSLDELPQIWNVLRGEMSFVGPRPIVEEEIRRYGDFFKLYIKVRPGLTGLWQVSGRNETTYDERVAMDAYYVRNWSVGLDLYILARTVWVVLTRKGAY